MTVLERPAVLPDVFARWFASRGWAPRAHQLELLAKAQAGRSVLLIAPTGGGKTLAGFLPSLVELSGTAASVPGSVEEKRKLFSTGRDVRRDGGLHTLYISPLKALAVDIARNLEAPVAEMRLPIRIETRTGDTPVSKRQRQRRDPPEILLTTPEQLALLLASADAPYLFGSLRRVILDELHALVISKRGDLLSLGLARLFRLAPNLTSIGLSATVAEPDELARFMVPQRGGARATHAPISSSPKAAPHPHVTMLDTRERLPWAGHSARHALDEIYQLIAAHTHDARVRQYPQPGGRRSFSSSGTSTTTISPSRCITARSTSRSGARSKRAMAAGRLRAVVCTSSLDLGVDWGDVDLGHQCRRAEGRLAAAAADRPRQSPHGRAVEGRAGAGQPLRGAGMPRRARRHRRECAGHAAAAHRRARRAGAARARLRLRRAVSQRRSLRRSARRPRPMRRSTRADFDAVVDFVATGGYALKAYDRFARIREGKDGRWRIANPNVAQRYRLNVGTIVEADMLKVRLVRSRAAKVIPRGGRLLGEVEEYFVETMVPGDTFVFSGEILKYEALVEDEVYVSRATAEDPKVPAYEGGKFPLSTYLAARVRDIVAHPQEWRELPAQVREWLEIQQWRSQMPGARELLVETFPRANKHYLVCYPFEGRLAHQTLGMLLTRRLERARLRPLGFVANEYALAVWGLGDAAQRIARGELRARRPVRRGHAGRRPRSLARRIGADEAHVPQLRDHRRPDRAALPRAGEIPPPGHDLDRPRLRRAAQPPARPRAAARRPRRRRDRPPRRAPRLRNALAHPGPNRS